MAVVGIDHVERVFLAATLYARYGGVINDRLSRAADWVLSPDEIERARLLGSTLRLAQDLTGGATSLLDSTRLERTDDALVLWLPTEQQALDGDAVARRLEAVAKILGLKSRVATEDQTA